MYSKYALFMLFVYCRTLSSGEPHIKKEIIPEYEPVMLIELYKAGSSTPKKGNPFDRDYIKLKGNKSITEFGMRMHLNLGVDVRKIYPKLFDSIENAREVKVFSSASRACHMSATSHNIGLFRKVAKKHIELEFKNRHVKPQWN